jgi:exonuclease III
MRVGGVRLKVYKRRFRLCKPGSCCHRPRLHHTHLSSVSTSKFTAIPGAVWGAFICLSIAVFCLWCPYHGCGNRIGEASNPGPKNLKICTLNVNSLRLHLPTAALLEWDILCAQETGCTLLNINACLSTCKDSGIQLFHGPLIPASQSGGVAICSKAYHLIEGHYAHSEHYHLLHSSLRWKHMMVPLTRNSCLNLHTVYGFSGSNSSMSASHCNESLLQSLFLEIAQGGDAPALVMGDLNVLTHKSPTLQHAITNLGWVDVLHTLGDLSDTFRSTYEDFQDKRGSRIDFVLANPTALSLIVAAKVVHTRCTGGHSPIIVEIDCNRVSLAGFRLDPLRTYVAPPVKDQEPERRAAALAFAMRGAQSFHRSLSLPDLSDSWRLLNNLIDDYLLHMESGHTTIGEHKSAGFSFSLKSVLPPTTIVNGSASACTKQLVHLQQVVNTLLDLKYKVKRGDSIRPHRAPMATLFNFL